MKNIFIFSIAFLAAFAIIFMLAFTPIDSTKQDSKTSTNQKSKDANINLHFLPSTLDFCGEEVPLIDEEVKERLDREMTINVKGLLATNTLILKKTKRYFPVFDSILKANKVPLDFKYLAMAESGLAIVTSPSGAAGFWQFMPETAKRFRLKITDDIDERNHVEKSTQAACDYLNFLYAKFNSWTKAAAAYNRGENGLQKALEEQKIDTFYDLYLNQETSRYIFRILSFKEIVLNPEKYDYILSDQEYYQPFQLRKIKVDATINDLALFAKENGSNYKLLRYYNPWLMKYKMNVKPGDVFWIELP